MKKTLLFTLLVGGLLSFYSCTCNKGANEGEDAEGTEQTDGTDADADANSDGTADGTEGEGADADAADGEGLNGENTVDLGSLSQEQYDDCAANLTAYYNFLVEYDKKLEENRLNASVLEKEKKEYEEKMENCKGSPTMKAMIDRKLEEIQSSHAPGA